jgi:hypothetical protein
MDEKTALSKMVPPGRIRVGKPAGGVIQIHLTRACNLSCYSCTQGSNLAGKTSFMSLEHFGQACKSLHGYFGTIGVFGGNPCTHPQFGEVCKVLRSHFPKDKCGLWSNNLMGWGKDCRITFSEAKSNLNVHLDKSAYEEMRRDWPESRPFGLHEDSRHSPPFVAMKDVLKKECPECKGIGSIRDDWFVGDETRDTCRACKGTGKVYDEEKAWELISNCDINQHWSAMIGVFRGQLRAWFCEVAGAQAMLHQYEEGYPDTGIPLTGDGSERTQELEVCFGSKWWQLPMQFFAHQVRKHCHECGVPLRGYGELAQSRDTDLLDMGGDVIQHAGKEQTSETHQSIYKPKRASRKVEIVTHVEQLGIGRLQKTTDYMGNAKR